MKPPFFARALLATATTRSAYDCVSGDLHEEYIQRVAARGIGEADRWYWSQALGSVAPLLIAPDATASTGSRLKSMLVASVVLVSMLVAGALANGLLDMAFRGTFAPLWIHFTASWLIVGIAGFVLASLCRDRSARQAFVGASCFVGVIALPSLTGFSSPMLPLAWLLLVGVIPALTAGASVGHALRRS